MSQATEPPSIPLLDLERAVAVIRAGGVVAFPTETYYGLAADPFNKEAISRLFALKRRPPDKPVLTLIGDQAQLPLLTGSVPELYLPLIRTFWPGPLTLVFAAVSAVPVILTGYTGTVGIRISSHPVARQLVVAAGQPLTATSANFSGQPAAITAQEVVDQLGPDVDFVIDGGATPGGKGSTIVALEEGRVTLLRAGVITFEEVLDQLKP